jgi:hypothetical protein
MDGPRRSDRKRTQTQFLGATEAPRSQTKESQLSACRAREAAVASAYEPLGGLVQLGEVGGGEGRVWVGADGSPALGGFAPTPTDRRPWPECYMQGRNRGCAWHGSQQAHACVWRWEVGV